MSTLRAPTAVAADATELASALDRLAAERPADAPRTQPQEAGSSAPA